MKSPRHRRGASPPGCSTARPLDKDGPHRLQTADLRTRRLGACRAVVNTLLSARARARSTARLASTLPRLRPSMLSTACTRKARAATRGRPPRPRTPGLRPGIGVRDVR